MMAALEKKRLELQEALDQAKSPLERNKLGQFATPNALASDILAYAKSLLPSATGLRFLDPAFGTGAFYSALLACFPASALKEAVGYEIDPHYGLRALELWRDTPLKLKLGDFTKALPPANESNKPNLVVCNPPYVRHHHLAGEDKPRLKALGFKSAGVELSGLAGLYCYFLCLSHAWMAKDALAIWLIPSEFMDVNYGQAVKEYLLNRVTLTRLHRFDPKDVQFDDALVSSAVVCFRNSPPPPVHAVDFTYGGSLKDPHLSKSVTAQTLRRSKKWTGLAFEPDHFAPNSEARLSDFFTIKRGIATGSNSFFILRKEKASQLGIPRQFLKPILPSPRNLPATIVQADESGNPLVDRELFLLDCDLPEDQVKARHPALWRYLEEGISQGVDRGYICAHRSPWYSQEKRQPPAILCTYMGRKGKTTDAFRSILNHSNAIAANVYLMLYPKPSLARLIQKQPKLRETIWAILRRIPIEALTGVGRVYGGGLHKLEPKELADAPVDDILEILPRMDRKRKQLALF